MKGSKKDKKRFTSGSVKVDPSILDRARKVCKKKGYLLSAYINTALIGQLQGDEDDAQ